MEFVNQVRQLKNQTKSPEVRQICEDYLNGKSDISPEQISNVLNENFAAVPAIPNVENYRDAIRREEASTSKQVAEMLMESWGGVKDLPLNNSGTYLIKEHAESNDEVISKIASVSGGDSVAKSFVDSQNLRRMGVLDSIAKIEESSIYEHYPVKILCEKYKSLIEYRNIPEFQLIQNFISEASAFKWDFTVSGVVSKLDKRIEKYSREIEVSKVLESIKSSGSSSFYSELSESLNSWLISEEKSSRILSKSISKWAFNPVVRNLVNYLNVNESRSSRNLEIPTVSQSESSVSRVYSPVSVGKGGNIFSIGKSLFEASEYGIVKLTQKQISRVPQEYLNLVSVLNSNGVRVNENGVFIALGNKTVRLVEENSDISVYLDKSKLNFKTLGELGKLLSLETNTYLGVNENEAIGKVITAYRGFGDIVELDFAKSIVSNIYEGVSANLIKWEGKIYINRVNEGMRENSLFQVNGTQAVNMVKEFLRYDISEGLTEFLEGEQKVKSVMNNDRNKVLENISKIETEISKIERLMETNELYANSKEIKSAQNLLNRELSVLKEKWNQINLELAKIEMSPDAEDDIMEDERFNIGSYVKIKESGESGKIVSVDGTSGRYTVLLDSGKTSEYLVNEIVDLDSALNQAANDNEESQNSDSDEDGEEEMKESMKINTLNKSKLSIEEQKKILKTLATNHSFASAPKGEHGEIDMGLDGFHGYNLTMNEAVKKIQSQYKNGQLVKAPGDDKMAKGKDANKKNLATAPGSSKMVKGKEQGKNLLRDAPGKEGDVDFDGEDAAGNKYEIGYNIAEGKTTGTNYAKTPNGGSKVNQTSGTTKNKTLAHSPENGKQASQTKGTTANNLSHAPKSGKHAGETNRPTLMNSLISAPDHGKKAKETNSVVSGIAKRQGLVSAPGKDGNVDFKASKDLGYNLAESEDLKKK